MLSYKQQNSNSPHYIRLKFCSLITDKYLSVSATRKQPCKVSNSDTAAQEALIQRDAYIGGEGLN